MKNVFGFANRAECTAEGRRWVQGSTNQQMRQFHCLEIKGTGE